MSLGGLRLSYLPSGKVSQKVLGKIPGEGPGKVMGQFQARFGEVTGVSGRV